MCASIVPNSSRKPAGAQYVFYKNFSVLGSVSSDGSMHYNLGKRAFDLFLLFLAMPVLVPLFVLIAIAVKTESSGPVFYAHRRIGHLGRPFLMYKFRSMHTNAEAMRASLLHLNEATWPEFKLTKDPRITRVGRYLRALSLDELPQLFNVLKGEMSLVGPRANSAPLEEYEPWQLMRLSVTPGIAGPAQLFGRHASFEEKCRRELEYISHQTMAADIKLLFKVLVKLTTAPDGK